MTEIKKENPNQLDPYISDTEICKLFFLFVNLHIIKYYYIMLTAGGSLPKAGLYDTCFFIYTLIIPFPLPPLMEAAAYY